MKSARLRTQNVQWKKKKKYAKERDRNRENEQDKNWEKEQKTTIFTFYVWVASIFQAASEKSPRHIMTCHMEKLVHNLFY